MKKFALLVLIILLFVSIFANVAFVKEYISIGKDRYQNTNYSINTDFKLLSPNLGMIEDTDKIVNLSSLRTGLNDYASRKDDTDTKVGIYFEYLPTGMSIGVNDKEVFYQASLVKVPMAMATYEKIANGELNKSDLLEIREEHIDKQFGDLWKQGVGHKITVEDTLKLMLQKSDNTAYRLLYTSNPTYLDEIFDYLDLPKESLEQEPAITPKNYSSIFKSLYFSSFNNPKDSNEILQTLTDTSFNQGITAPIPTDVPVAHKIGSIDSKDVHSDCGIFYPDSRPYILCVMVRASEVESNQIMSEVSEIVFDFVRSQ